MGVMAAWLRQAAITPINLYYALLLFSRDLIAINDF